MHSHHITIIIVCWLTRQNPEAPLLAGIVGYVHIVMLCGHNSALVTTCALIALERRGRAKSSRCMARYPVTLHDMTSSSVQQCPTVRDIRELMTSSQAGVIRWTAVDTAPGTCNHAFMYIHT